MAIVNENFFKLKTNHVFETVLEKKNEYLKKHPNAKLIHLGIGDVTLPLTNSVTDAMHRAVDELGKKETFRGYGLVPGYDFLREKISEYDYQNRGIDISTNEIFIADGTKNDAGNIIDLFSENNTVAITDPVYPVYRDTNIMFGRHKIVYLECTEENNFTPQLPKEKVDMIYLCCPNNPTGTVLKTKDLQMWVEYARENHSIILYDSVYESFITEDDVPHSIYEIEGAKDVAIEFRSFSKLAGFTGVRCSFMVIPNEVNLYNKSNEKVKIQNLWLRRQNSKFGGVSYITQRGAEAIYSEEGMKEVHNNVKYYLENGKYLKTELKKLGFTVYGGTNSPYLWIKVPEKETSWSFFDRLLNEANVVTTPGAGFGKCGEGFIRITSFGSKEDSMEAIKRIAKVVNRDGSN